MTKPAQALKKYTPDDDDNNNNNNNAISKYKFPQDVITNTRFSAIHLSCGVFVVNLDLCPDGMVNRRRAEGGRFRGIRSD